MTINRIQPAMPAQAYDTYMISAPLSTHFRAATCKEVDCLDYINGWKSIIDESTDLGQKQAAYIRHHSGRRFVEDRELEGLTTFVFFAEQECFRGHQVRVGRPEIYLKARGDWRGFVTPVRRLGVDDWVDDFQEHQDKLVRELERG